MKKLGTMKAMKGAKSAMITNRQKGFTIIELVVVILLLGILTATALPRFMNITEDARNAVQDATRGGLRTGIALLRATAIAQSTASGSPALGYGDGTLTVDGNGYPLISNTCDTIYSGLLQTGATNAIGTASGLICSYELDEVSRIVTLNTTTGVVN